MEAQLTIIGELYVGDDGLEYECRVCAHDRFSGVTLKVCSYYGSDNWQLKP